MVVHPGIVHLAIVPRCSALGQSAPHRHTLWSCPSWGTCVCALQLVPRNLIRGISASRSPRLGSPAACIHEFHRSLSLVCLDGAPLVPILPFALVRTYLWPCSHCSHGHFSLPWRPLTAETIAAS